MIALTRIRTEEAIPSKYRRPGVLKHGRDLLEIRRTDGDYTTSFWKRAKDQLKRETHGKCAYCEADTATTAHGDVEHYRPKKTYWWLTYCYDNYLYSCQICNQSYKGDWFPVTGDPLALDPSVPDPVDEGLDQAVLDGHAARLAPDPIADGEGRDAFYRASRAEKAWIPNPYEVDPAELFAWEADDVLKTVDVVRRGRGVRSKRAVEAAVEHLGLNRDELQGKRWKEYRKALAFARTLRDPGISDETREDTRFMLADMAAADAPYAGMIRYFLAEWGLKELLP